MPGVVRWMPETMQQLSWSASGAVAMVRDYLYGCSPLRKIDEWCVARRGKPRGS